jgi:hypothetical protein
VPGSACNNHPVNHPSQARYSQKEATSHFKVLTRVQKPIKHHPLFVTALLKQLRMETTLLDAAPGQGNSRHGVFFVCGQKVLVGLV